MSICWEYLEWSLSKNKTLSEFTTDYWLIPDRYRNETLHNKFIDLLCNLLGYAIGNLIHKKLSCHSPTVFFNI